MGYMKAVRSGRSRLYGEFEEAEGLVYDDWYRPLHWIDPIPVPLNAALYRVYDHGRRNPGAALWAFVPKPGTVSVVNGNHIKWPEDEIVMVFYREYYKRDRVISAHAEAIIEASGNTRGSRGERRMGPVTYQVWQEYFTSERYVVSLADPRSHNSPDSDTAYTLGDLYTLHGLAMNPATPMRVRDRVDVVREWLKPDYTRNHVVTGEPGFVKLMVFNNLTDLTDELEGYRNKEQSTRRGVAGANLSEEPQGKNDHLMDCLSWLCCYGPHYVEMSEPATRTYNLDNDWGLSVQKRKRNVDPITKY